MSPTEPEVIRADSTRRVRTLIALLSKELSDQVRTAVSDLQLTETQAAVLRELQEPLTQTQIAGALKCEPSNVTFVLDRLERRGLVSRVQHPTDRRAKVIHLTEDGWAVRTATIDRFEQSSPLGALTDTELAELERILEKVAVGEEDRSTSPAQALASDK